MCFLNAQLKNNIVSWKLCIINIAMHDKFEIITNNNK